jgi:glycyl-tRNA synthetase
MKSMNMNEHNTMMEKIINLCKNRGFIFQAGELYGGMAGIYDYGPLGSLLKNNIKNLWIKKFVENRRDMYLLDSAIIMGEKPLTASGHVGGFSDPMIECLNCGNKERTDNLLEKEIEYIKLLYGADLKINSKKTAQDFFEKNPSVKDNFLLPVLKNLAEEKHNLFLNAHKYLGPAPAIYLKSKKIPCNKCNKVDWADEAYEFNLMLKTQLGSSSDSSSTAYLRPETAQGIFVNYKNIIDSMHPKMPFGVAQIGKAYRNEITPRNFIFRLRELEQMEIEYFIHPDDWKAEFEYWREEMNEWSEMIGLDMQKLHEVEIGEADRAHYSQRTIDFEFEYPFGQKELYGLAYRGSYDLDKHAEGSKTKLHYTDTVRNETFVPHVIEPSMGLDRTILAILASAYREDELDGSVRTYLAFDPLVAPYKIAVCPLVKNKDHIVEKAQDVFSILKAEFGNVAWDDNGNIGKCYRRQDEIGTPFCVVVDYNTLEEGHIDFGTVSIRYRDTAQQERVTLDALVTYVHEQLKKNIS